MIENIEAQDKTGETIHVGDFVRHGTVFCEVKKLEDPWGIAVYNAYVLEVGTNRRGVFDARLLEKLTTEEALLLMLEM